MGFRFEAQIPSERVETETLGPIETLELTENVLIINGTTYPIVEWLYPVNGGSRQITEPTVIFKDLKTNNKRGITISMLEQLFGHEVPLPIGKEWPGKQVS